MGAIAEVVKRLQTAEAEREEALRRKRYELRQNEAIDMENSRRLFRDTVLPEIRELGLPIEYPAGNQEFFACVKTPVKSGIWDRYIHITIDRPSEHDSDTYRKVVYTLSQSHMPPSALDKPKPDLSVSTIGEFQMAFGEWYFKMGFHKKKD